MAELGRSVNQTQPSIRSESCSEIGNHINLQFRSLGNGTLDSYCVIRAFFENCGKKIPEHFLKLYAGDNLIICTRM